MSKLPGWIVLIMALTTQSALAQIYKWTDADGNVHFGSQPPPEVMQDAKDTGISSQQGTRASLEGALPGSDWLARSGNQLIKLEFKSNGRNYLWKETSLLEDGSRGRTRKKFGDYRIEGERLVFTPIDENREALAEETFLARLSGTDSLKLVDINVPGRVFQLAAEPTSTRPLRNDQENAVLGTWTQVSYRMEDNIVGYLHFDGGIFYLYDPRQSGNRIGATPSDKDKVASGKWEVRDNVLHLDFWEASGSAASRMLKQERWHIVSLDHRRMEVTDSSGRRTQVFRRERTR